jgi:pyruvate kinase
VPLPSVGITEKDTVDLQFGLQLGVDLVALSFVQSAGDIWRARKLVAQAGRGDVPLIAKIERPEAIAKLEEVMEAADAVMVARGDLGLELPLERVPRLQKEVLRLARARGIPAIVATQVLESMRTEPRPTRAEVSDAAGAVDGGADAIMLSGETAVGAYPVRAVEILDNIITDAEAMPPPWILTKPEGKRADHVQALCDAAATLANHGQADAIVAITRQGRTAQLLSARRPHAAIYAAADRADIARRLALWWGIVPLVTHLEGSTDEVADRALADMHATGFAAHGIVVVVNASPNLDSGQANFLRIRKVP